MRKILFLVVVTLMVVFVAAACGDDDDGDTTSSTEGQTVDEASGNGDSGDGDAAGPVATLESDGYGPKAFTIGSCTNEGETDLILQAEADNLALTVDAPDGTGNLAVDGGTESDGITLNGDINAVTVGDAGNFTVTGTFTEPNNVGEEFTLTGSCAGV